MSNIQKTQNMAFSVPSLFSSELLGRIFTLIYRPVSLYSISYLVSHKDLTDLRLIVKQRKLLGRKVLRKSELEV